MIVAREAHLVHRDRDTSRTPRAPGRCSRTALGHRRRYAAALGGRRELTVAVEASLAGVDVLAGRPSATRPRSRTRRSGPARTTGKAGSPARTT